jgi:Zn-finger nucleic acid-binding protein
MKCIGCPKCIGQLQKVIYQKIEIDRCDHCAGIWFDRLEAEQLKQIKGSEYLDKCTIPRSNRRSHTSCCPKCQQQMLKMLDLDKHAIWYEKCSRCQGIWLEAGQFSQYKQNFSQKGVINLAKQVFSK